MQSIRALAKKSMALAKRGMTLHHAKESLRGNPLFTFSVLGVVFGVKA